MADYTLSAKITGDSSSFTNAFKRAKETTDDLGEKLGNVGAKTQQFGQKTALVGAGLTAGVTLSFVKAAQGAIDFDSAMRKAGAIAGASAVEFKQMTDAALELGASTSLSANEVAIAMAEMAAKGFDATNAIAAMPGVIAAAEASGENLALTADVVSSALNGFRLEASKSSNVADILAMAANKTAAGVADMGHAYKYAAPLAASLGISIEELSAATGLMVNAGLEGSQAGTTLRQALISLSKPTEKSSKTMEMLGFEVLDANNNFKPLNQIVGELSASMEGMSEAQKIATLATLFGTEAASGMNVLLNEGQGNLKALTTELENSGGASAEAAAQMKAGMGGAMENLSGAVESLSISIMSTLFPFLVELANKATSVMDRFNGMSDSTKKMVAFGALGVAVLGPLLTMLGFMVIGIGALISAVGMITAPILIVVAAIVALIAIFVLFREEITAIWHSHVKPIFMELASFVTTTLKPVFQEGFEAVTTIIKTAFEMARNLWESILQPAFESIMSAMQADLVPAFKDAFVIVADVVKTAFGIVSTLWTSVLQPIFNYIVNNLKYTLLPTFQFVFGAFSSVVSTVFHNISQLWTKSLKPILVGITDFLAGVFTLNWQKAWSGLVSMLGGIFGGIVTVLKAPLNAAIGLINAAIGGINAISVDIPDWVPKFGGKKFGVDIPKLPLLARGTDDWEGGFARINEGGRGELVNLPNGAQVIPHDVSMKYAREIAKNTSVSHDDNSTPVRGGITQHLSIYSNRPLSPSEVARKSKQAATELALEWGVV